MKKGAFLIVLAIIASIFCFSSVGCSDKKPAAVDSVATTDSDSMAVVDTMATIITESPMPKTADELFDDFIFNFAANRKLQYSRIQFPLSVTKFGKKSEMTKKSWRMERFFMTQDYYTLIFDSKRQMSIVKDTTINHVVVEKIYLNTNIIKQYVFNRLQGQWKLTGLNVDRLKASNNSSFLKFYKAFVADSAFQVKSINDPLQFSGPDPDDEFNTMTGFLTPEQWPSFAPELPGRLIYNILYGQKYAESNRKIFVMRGIANGLETELTFKCKGGHWKLIQLSM